MPYILSIAIPTGILYVMTDKYKATLWLTEKNISKLKKRAIDQKRSISQIVDELIEQYLKEQSK